LSYLVSGYDYSTGYLKQSLNVSSLLKFPVHSLPLREVLIDDSIALENAEFVVLALMVDTSSNCRQDLSPNNTTTIIVSDDDGKSLSAKPE